MCGGTSQYTLLLDKLAGEVVEALVELERTTASTTFCLQSSENLGHMPFLSAPAMLSAPGAAGPCAAVMF